MGTVWIDIVFSGGGVKGFAFAGALSQLEKSGYQFKRAAGTSAGSIVAALLMAGYSPAELETIVSEMNTGKLLDASAESRFPFFRWLRVYFKMGLYRGDLLEQWLMEMLAHKGVSTFSDLPEGALRVVASDVSRGKMVVFPNDLVEYGVDPNAFSVARAVRMSAGLPLFFEPSALFDENGKRSLIVDGGILSNFPIWLFDREADLPVRPFLGLRIVDAKEENYTNVKNAAELFRGIFTAMHNAHDERTTDKLKDSNIISIPVTHVETRDMEISVSERKRLFRIGAEETRQFLQKWSF